MNIKDQIIPTVIEKSSRGPTFAYDIYSRLLEDRIIFLSGPINDPLANTVVAQILYLSSKDSQKDIKLYVNSPGGIVSSGLAIYDTIQYVKAPVMTICVGTAASMAAVLLAAGAKGKRILLPNSVVLLHQIMGGAEGQAVDVEIQARHILKVKDQINKILAHHTEKPIGQIAKDTDRDFYLDAKSAVEYGVADKILEPSR
ncbi:MAG: ATP-dependent Clp protease proteolytic subunit [Candidatus Colwellbacteria bacterium]|nr:ATP-dependent Clp protease proteolytic subunit [Candidatus Colwellbacteria bacterium]